MIIGDISEKKKTHDAFTKRLGENYAIKQLGVFDCEIEKVLLANGKKTFCASNEEAPILLDAGFEYLEIRPRCSKCDNRCYVRFADFEIAPKRAYFERKTAADFVASRKQRLYEQLIKMDMFVEDGRKGLILEIWLAWSPHKRGVMRKPILKNRPHPLPRPNGMPRDWKPKIKLQDSKGFFSGFDKKVHNLRGLSPLEIGLSVMAARWCVANNTSERFDSVAQQEQAIEIGQNPEWTYSFIRECKMRGIEFVQTWDLNETIEFLVQCDAGYDQTPKLRILPKRYPDIPLEQNILVLFKGIGKETSAKILKKYGSLGKLITSLRKMDEETAKGHKIIYSLWKMFK